MLTYLEGARFKLQSALLELDHKPRGSHPLAAHIQITRDRTGLQQSILKVPLWLKTGEDEGDAEAGDAVDDDDAVDMPSVHTVDSRNETLIKHFDRNFNRSKSNLEYGGAFGGAGLVFDRGIADGGSNQHDSDFGEWMTLSRQADEALINLINLFR